VSIATPVSLPGTYRIAYSATHHNDTVYYKI
jgi:hypothetical protein